MFTVQHILQDKSPGLYVVSPETAIFDALEVMAEKNIGAVMVVESGHVMGVFSERDYARKILLKGRRSSDLTVSHVMSRDVIAVTLSTSVEACMKLMTDKRIRHLPVIDNNALIGVVSIGDVVKWIISEQKSTISHLEDYITGRR
jgi:CBS domain-containing protein